MKTLTIMLAFAFLAGCGGAPFTAGNETTEVIGDPQSDSGDLLEGSAPLPEASAPDAGKPAPEGGNPLPEAGSPEASPQPEAGVDAGDDGALAICQMQVCTGGVECGLSGVTCDGQQIDCGSCAFPGLCGSNGIQNRCGSECHQSTDNGCQELGYAWEVSSACHTAPYTFDTDGGAQVRANGMSGCVQCPNPGSCGTNYCCP